MDVNQFRLDLKDLEDDEGIVYLDTHRHNTTVTLSGVTYARTFEIINGYTVTFEDGTYTVVCVGANHNISDVKNVNSVSLIIGNAAGLIQVSSGSGLSAEEHDELMSMQAGIRGADDEDLTTISDQLDATELAITDLVDLLIAYVKNKKALVKVGAVWHLRIYDVDGITPIVDKELKDKNGANVTDIASGVLAQEFASV